MLVVILLLLFILLRMINPPAENANAEPPGNLTVHIVWPVGNVDVDLWLDGPGEPRPVGYSRKSGKLWDLLRDDLGTVPDASGINYESGFTRGVVAGNYTIGLHCYRCPQLPQVVQVEVAINTGDPGSKSPMRVLVTTTVTLTKNGQEKTAIRFYLEADGTIRPGSMNAVFKPLRSAKR